MFDNHAYDELIDKLRGFSNLPENKQRKFLRKLMLDEEFMGWMFCPAPGSPIATPQMTTTLYELLTKPKVIHAMTDMIEDYGYEKFSRTPAALLYTISKVAADANNSRADALIKKQNSNDISGRDAKELKEKIETITLDISALLKCARRISKSDSKALSKVTHLDKNVCMDAYWSVPAPQYIDKYKVGRYLNNLMDIMYSYVADGIIPHPTEVNWRAFFKEIFGKDNIDEVATFILLEGVHRINKYHGDKAVRDCWDALTKWSLGTLNTTTSDTRRQMIELYIKRIDKMFQNRSVDLRVNLLELGNQFPNLTETIENYRDKISSIIGRDRSNKVRVEEEDDDD